METNHARGQAKAQYEAIVDLLAAGDDEAITENALEVQVRSDWHNPGERDVDKHNEFYILLCTGGPAVRLIGDLNQYGEPENARLEYQDWGTPWECYHPADFLRSERSKDVLVEYAQHFCFGG